MPFAFEEMSSGVEHTVGVLVADEVLDAVLEVTDAVPEDRVGDSEVWGATVLDADAEVVEDESEFSATTPLAGVDCEWTLMTFFAIRAPTTAPAIARIATTPAIHNPTAC